MYGQSQVRIKQATDKTEEVCSERVTKRVFRSFTEAWMA